MNEKLINQINNSPELLRSYIHSIETGDISELVQENFALREKLRIINLISMEIINESIKSN